MIDFYPLLAFSFGAFIHYILKKSKTIIYFMLFIFSFFIYLNLEQSYQKRHHYIHWDSMTKAAYWNVFLKHSLTDEERKEQELLLITPDYQKALKGEDEYDFKPF